MAAGRTAPVGQRCPGRRFAPVWVRGVSVDHKEHLALHAGDQPLQELAKYLGVDATLDRHEAKLALRGDCREHVESVSRTRGLDHRRFARRRPGRARVMIRANARLVVGEEDQRALTLCACRNRWVFVLPPVIHQCRVLLPRAVQRTLRREFQTLHQAPNRHFAQVHVERLPDQLANDGPTGCQSASRRP